MPPLPAEPAASSNARVRLHHLALRTRDPDALARWWAAVFALPVVPAPRPEVCWLRLDDALLMIEPSEPGEPGVPAGTLEFAAFRVTPAERDDFARRCEALAVPIEHRTAWTIYVRDPDGRRVGVSCFDAVPSAAPVR